MHVGQGTTLTMRLRLRVRFRSDMRGDARASMIVPWAPFIEQSLHDANLYVGLSRFILFRSIEFDGCR